MSGQRTYGLLLIILQAAVMGYLSRDWFFPTLIIASAASSVLTKRRWAVERSNELRAYFILGAGFLAASFIFPHGFRGGTYAVYGPQAYAVAQFLMLAQTMQFWLRRTDDRLPMILPGLAGVSIACAFDLNVQDPQRLACQLFTIAYLVLAVCYLTQQPARTARARQSHQATQGGRGGHVVRRLVMAALVLLISAVSWVSASALFRFENRLDELLVRVMGSYIPPNRVGFSKRAKLGSVALEQGSHSKQIALRVESEQSPGYLRGRVFETYHRSEWRAAGAGMPLRPVREVENDRLAPGGRLNDFEAIRIEADGWDRWTCWPDESLGGNVFAPLQATRLQAAVDQMTVSWHGVFSARDFIAGHPYVALAPTDVQKLVDELPVPPDELQERLLAIPAQLDPRVSALAERIFADCRTTTEKIAAVQDYFQSEYKYSLNIEIPSGSEPLEHFLLEKPAAHCEFFASGAVTLLRLSGVPCRYVTGFLVHEKNSFGGNWVARKRDAHAWAEAYDESAGWVTVEATPSGGVPQAETASAARQLWEHLVASVRQFRVRFQHGGIHWLMAAVGRFLVSIPTMIALLAIAAWLLWRRYHDRRTATADKKSPLLKKSQRLLAKMDRRMQRLSVRRETGETLHHFAGRIRSLGATQFDVKAASDWYETYARLRYSERLNAETLGRLSDAYERAEAL